MKGTFVHVHREYDQCGEIGAAQKDGAPCFVTCGTFWLCFKNKKNHQIFLSTNFAFILLSCFLGEFVTRPYRLIDLDAVVGDKWMTYKSN